MVTRPLLSFLREWRDMRRFRALDASVRTIVFYAEDTASWVHFEPIVRELTGPMNRDICYLTSAHDDPILSEHRARIHAFCIGRGLVRTLLFATLRAGVAVLTMPDLETFHIKRSRVHPVHYAYVFHSIVSTHMVYRRGAFDHYDTVFCVGPRHTEEIRATEARYSLPPKRLIEHGYGRLDTILNGNHTPPANGAGRTKRLLIAPSWGPNGLLETCGVRLIGILLDAGYHVTVRPHPETRRKWPQAIRDIETRFANRSHLVLETDIASTEALRRADVMISDFSGVALEYAFGWDRPVLFVDVPRKVNNPDYAAIGCEPIEVAIREKIGAVVSPDNLEAVPGRIEMLCKNAEAFRDRIRQVCQETVFNVGHSGRVGAEAIVQIADGEAGV